MHLLEEVGEQVRVDDVGQCLDDGVGHVNGEDAYASGAQRRQLALHKGQNGGGQTAAVGALVRTDEVNVEVAGAGRGGGGEEVRIGTCGRQVAGAAAAAVQWTALVRRRGQAAKGSGVAGAAITALTGATTTTSCRLVGLH